MDNTDKNNIPELHHITRYDYDDLKVTVHLHGYKFQRKINGKIHGKQFADSKFNGKEGSYKAAMEYRDKILEKYGLTLKSRGRNTSDAHLVRYDVDKVRNHGSRKLWAFQIWHEGKQHQKTFSDGKYGDKDKSKAAAIEYRDNFIADNKIDINERYSDSEIPGVHKTYSLDNKGKKQFYYQVTWYEGKTKNKRFSVTTHGEEGAIHKAIDFRKQIDRQLKGSGSTVFITPENANIKIWRYMDFTKFVYSLDKSALFFTHVDKLGDPYEGSYSHANKWLRKLAYSKAKDSRSQEEVLEMMREARKDIFVNCWHMNEGESAAMWLLYAKTNEAICIQSTFGRLAKTVPDYTNIGTVKYIDYEKEWIPEDGIYHPFLYKRKSFAHEKEIRALIYSKDKKVLTPLKRDENGISIKLDLNMLIDRIYVSPQAPEWFYDLVADVTLKYNLKKKVEKSALDSVPLK